MKTKIEEIKEEVKNEMSFVNLDTIDFSKVELIDVSNAGTFTAVYDGYIAGVGGNVSIINRGDPSRIKILNITTGDRKYQRCFGVFKHGAVLQLDGDLAYGSRGFLIIYLKDI